MPIDEKNTGHCFFSLAFLCFQVKANYMGGQHEKNSGHYDPSSDARDGGFQLLMVFSLFRFILLALAVQVEL